MSYPASILLSLGSNRKQASEAQGHGGQVRSPGEGARIDT